MKKKIWRSSVVVMIGIQFIPYHIKNEPIDAKQDIFANVDADQSVIDLVRAACYDCHSHEAVTPWYGRIAPIKFWLNKHTRGGRMNLDFSHWTSYDQATQDHKLKECVDRIGTKEMPLNSYTLMHPEAKLSSDQRKQLMLFFERLR